MFDIVSAPGCIPSHVGTYCTTGLHPFPPGSTCVFIQRPGCCPCSISDNYTPSTSIGICDVSIFSRKSVRELVITSWTTVFSGNERFGSGASFTNRGGLKYNLGLGYRRIVVSFISPVAAAPGRNWIREIMNNGTS